MRGNNVRDQILPIKELVAVRAKEVFEAAANTLTVPTDSSDADHQAILSQASAAHSSNTSDCKKPRLMFASYLTQVDAQGSSLSAATRTAEEELDEYLSSARLPPTADVMSFWKFHISTYLQVGRARQSNLRHTKRQCKCRKMFLSCGFNNPCASPLHAATNPTEISFPGS